MSIFRSTLGKLAGFFTEATVAKTPAAPLAKPAGNAVANSISGPSQ